MASISSTIPIPPASAKFQSLCPPSSLAPKQSPSSRALKPGIESSMASATVDASGNPIPTSAVLMASSKHIATMCRSENMAFINCKKKDQNPEKCLDKGRQVSSCVLNLLKSLHQRCSKEMDGYAGCMFYHTNEFDLCRKEQQDFEAACPWSSN